MPTDFSSQTYWQDRFTADHETFEWIGPGELLVPFLPPTIHDVADGGILHIGCGSSELSLALRRLVGDEKATSVVNLDFAPAAIEIGREREISAFGDVRMRWTTADLLNWSSLEPLAQENGSDKKYGIVVEKSCIDALSCGLDVCVEGKTYYPPDLLAIHLARLTVPGALWVVMSYSSSRFDFLKNDESEASVYWEMVGENRMKAEEKPTEGGGFKPKMWNFVYSLRRTEKEVPA